jgi:co-chaperonin GroES (HSP10)
MKLYARNRNLVIELEEEKKKTESGVLVPDEYVKVETGYKVGKILDSQKDSQFEYDKNCYVVFASHMIQTFEFCGQKFTTIPESAVYGVFRERPVYEPEY